jgi:suppressor for copper-sensitivity B
LLILPILLLAGTFAYAAPAQAAASAWAEGDQARLRLISASDAVGSERAVTLGLHIQLKPTWKIYWRSPGDAGLPPQLDWSGSSNLASAEMRWPVPHRFTLFGLDTFGYEGEVVLPLMLRLNKPGEAADLKAKIRYLVCDPQICVPAEAALALTLPAGPAAPAAEAELIQRFTEEVPGDGRDSGLRLASVTVGRVGNRPGLIVEAEAEPPFAKPDVIVEGPESLSFRAPKVTLMDGGRRARLEVPTETQQANAPGLAGLPLTLTLYDGKRGLEAAVKPAAATPVGAPILLVMLGFAFIGGLILNFMPCVLPVLALKLLGVVGQGGRERAAIRASFLASAAGILFSFLVLAAALIFLKSAGAVVGWGIQFQQPLFLAVLTLILVLFAGNLFGLFEIPLPSWAGGIAQGSGNPHHGNSIAGAFAAGAFATLLATPCSAPFLGTALGFAFSRGPGGNFADLRDARLGLAAPWILGGGDPPSGASPAAARAMDGVAESSPRTCIAGYCRLADLGLGPANRPRGEPDHGLPFDGHPAGPGLARAFAPAVAGRRAGRSAVDRGNANRRRGGCSGHGRLAGPGARRQQRSLARLCRKGNRRPRRRGQRRAGRCDRRLVPHLPGEQSIGP